MEKVICWMILKLNWKLIKISCVDFTQRSKLGSVCKGLFQYFWTQIILNTKFVNSWLFYNFMNFLKNFLFFVLKFTCVVVLQSRQCLWSTKKTTKKNMICFCELSIFELMLRVFFLKKKKVFHWYFVKTKKKTKKKEVWKLQIALGAVVDFITRHVTKKDGPKYSARCASGQCIRGTKRNGSHIFCPTKGVISHQHANLCGNDTVCGNTKPNERHLHETKK